MKKLTAVELLENIIYADKEFSLSEAFKQAKELEKYQIVEAFDIADNNYPSGNGYDNGSNYYSETFNQTES